MVWYGGVCVCVCVCVRAHAYLNGSACGMVRCGVVWCGVCVCARTGIVCACV